MNWVEETWHSPSPTPPSTHGEGPAPTVYETLVKSQDDSTNDPDTSLDSPRLLIADKSVFHTERRLNPNDENPPLSRPTRAFGNIVPLPVNPASGSVRGYRSHVPLTVQVRLNDTDGRALSSLLDTGASLSVIDAGLLRRLGGVPSGTPMRIHGLGDVMTLGWVTIPVFLHAQDPHGKATHLSFAQDFHVLPSFAPGLCLGRDFIDAQDLSVSPVRGRGRIGRYTFQVNERLPGPYDQEPELITTSDIDLCAGEQRWVPVGAHCLAPDIDYAVIPRLSTVPDESVRLFGPAGLLRHAPVGHVLLGNYGSCTFHLQKGTIVADAYAARVGDVTTDAGELFALAPARSSVATAGSSSPELPPSDVELALPLDAFELADATGSSLTADAAVSLVDDQFRVGIDTSGAPHPDIVALLRQNAEAFALDGRPGRVDDHDMEINLLPAATLRSDAPRRASPEKRAAMDTTIDQLLSWDVIEPSSSPVSFPVVMVRQNGKWRFCVDYRTLNTSTIPDRYPLPTIDSIFQTLAGKKVFSSLDAIRGYHQLGVKESDRWKTAFICHRGLFQYKRVPFGLRNAPAVFQRLMDQVLGPLRWSQAVVYIDDAVIATDSMDEHLRALDTLLRSAVSTGLKFSPAKCTFAVPSLVLLGRKVSGAGVAVWEERAKAVEDLRRPTTLQELYHTLGLFGYYRSFIRKFADLASPLTKLLRGWRYESADGQTRLVNTEGKAVTASKIPLQWDAEQQHAFDALRRAVANPPILAHPDSSRPYVLYVDASKHALAAIVHQVHDSAVPASSAAQLNHLGLSQLPTTVARERWRAWLAEDRFFGPILSRLQDSTPDPDWVVSEGILVRRPDDRVALPLAAVSTVMRALHDDQGHFGFMKTFLSVTRQFWRPGLSTVVRSWVKHCGTCQATKQAPKTGSLTIQNDPSLPFETVSFDLVYGFPRSQAGKDTALVIQDQFSRMVLLHPCAKDISAEGVAAVFSDRVLRYGWRPRRIVTDSEARVSGAVMTAVASSLGAETAPSSPYHQQANSVERAVQTIQRVLASMALDSRAHWDRRVLPSVELAMNSSPALTTGYRPFDLVFMSHPDVVHAVFDAGEHLGVGSFPERLAAARERLEDARRHIVAAREVQKRRYDAKRAPVPSLAVGMRAWIRLTDRPVAGTGQDKLAAKKLGPFLVEEVLSPHRVRLRLPDHLQIDPVLNVEQLDFAPTDVDPFAAERERLSGSVRAVPSSVSGAPLDPALPDVPPASSASEDGLALAAVPRVRRAPRTLREFDLGTVSAATPPPVGSDALADALAGPVGRPRRLVVDGCERVLQERPVAFLSRLTSPAESKLVASELELVCFTWAYHKLAHLFEGFLVTVVTDHAPMERMLVSSNTIPYGPTISRCRAVVMPHLPNLRFVYRPGALHTNADALSRLPPASGSES
ncbi:hypothetical protein CF336_g7520 [Tilletia laevis]|uniref:RNA-directed DNA polymerase n=1 Tax=Tilletia caries TaxID=13290 RepID=A0A177U4H7_9BASI|nr:hypothetical protein CF336_g7520 [Tilletia laevis]KAE8247964.1 hypothetical protein A4X03_0g6908 [Tilletia caries]